MTCSSPRAAAPRGLSYLEVLIAASIALVGMLGAIAIIPLAARNMEKGRVADTMLHVGESAIGQFQTQGLARSQRWVFRDVATPAFGNAQQIVDASWLRNEWKNTGGITNANLVPFRFPCITPLAVRLPGNTGYAITNETAICFDPRMLIESSALDNATDNTLPSTSIFPYVIPSADNEIRMLRVSARSNSAVAASATGVQPLDARIANYIARSADDLIFERSEDETIPAVQSKTPDPINPPPAIPRIYKREYLGEFEWMATLVPKASRGGVSGEYILSIIVFHRRSPRLEFIDTAPDAVEIERVVDVTLIGGGDVRLTPRTGRSVNDLTVNEGDWLMLSFVEVPAMATSTTATRFGFQWYRVTAAAAELDMTGAVPAIEVSLQGGDWAPGDARSNLSATSRTQATIVSDVVGVFERTIRLDTNAQW